MIGMDPEVAPLCAALNAIPGVTTTGSCCGHGERRLEVHFRVTSLAGLFFVARCCDKRYWEFGNLWRLSVSAGDDGPLPTIFTLTSCDQRGEAACAQAASLARNIAAHLRNEQFIGAYELEGLL